jgi:hypothetical protein
MKILLLAAVYCAAALAGDPRISFTKDFPGSSPPWVGITVERSGDVVYKEAVDDEYPIKLKLDPAETAEIFQLADKLGQFTRQIESNLKVAQMGVKTFRFEDGSTNHEVKFNYSTDLDAQALLDWFERIVESEQHFIRLERTVKYDKLGVNQALLLFQISYDKKRVVAPEQFLPLLDRVVKNDSYLNMARERAAALAENIRGNKQAQGE